MHVPVLCQTGACCHDAPVFDKPASRARDRQASQLRDLSVAKLAPIASEMKRLVADPGHVDSILIDGANRARAIAAETMNAAKDIVGFIRKR